MADSKVTALGALAAVAAGDLLYAVDDPSGTPLSVKLDVDVLDTYLAATTKTLTNKTISALVATGDATFDTNTLFVDSTNNRVGLGLTNPQTKLSAVVTNTTGVSTEILSGQIASTTVCTVQHVREDASLGNSGLAFSTFLTGGTALREVVRVSAQGDVGIGTTSPNQKLTVEGTMDLKEQASANADTAAYGQIWVKNDTPNTLWFTDDAGTDTQLGAGGGGGSSNFFFAYLGSSQSVNNGSVTVVNFDTEGFDTGSDYDTTNKYYVAPSDGKYYFCVGLKFDAFADQQSFTMYLKVGGTNRVLKQMTSSGAGLQMQNLSCMIDLNTSDQVQLSVYQASGSAQSLNTNNALCYFRGYKIA